jgi:hypothetical protein
MFSDMALCAMKMQAVCKIDFICTGGVFWSHGLTAGMTEALSRGTPYILTLDYDTVFSPDDVIELVRLADANPQADAIVPMQMRRENMFPLFTYGENGHADGIIQFKTLAQELVPIISGHFGCTLLRTSMLNSISKPWFQEVPDGDGTWREDHPTRPRIDADAWFWRQMREGGFGLFLAPGVVVGHSEMLITWPTPRLEPVYQKISNYQSAGKPCDGTFDRRTLENQIAQAVESVQEGRGDQCNEGPGVGVGQGEVCGAGA